MHSLACLHLCRMMKVMVLPEAMAKKLGGAEGEAGLAIQLKDKASQHHHVLVSHCKISLAREKALSPLFT